MSQGYYVDCTVKLSSKNILKAKISEEKYIKILQYIKDKEAINTNIVLLFTACP